MKYKTKESVRDFVEKKLVSGITLVKDANGVVISGTITFDDETTAAITVETEEPAGE